MKRIIIGALALSAGAVFACDVCATHVALNSWEATRRVGLSLFEQYSKYDPEPGEEETFTSYNTQFAADYRFSDRWALQVGVPYIDREFGDESESGFGDATFIGVFRAVNAGNEKELALLDAYAGLKVPTGNTDPLKEERVAALAGEESEGHHLSLGSGSWDGIFGARGLAKRGRFLAAADVQYVARTEGDFDFEYGDEFISRAGLRYFAALEHEFSIAVGADVSRDWRDDNKVLGEELEEPDAASSYVGPAIDFTWGDALTASVGWDIAIEGQDHGVHGAADERYHASLGYLF